MAEGNQIYPIMELPEELRGAIFNKLPQHEVLNLRLVSKQCQHDVENYFDFKIRLDDRSPYFEKILGLRIKKCEVNTVNKTLHVSYETGSLFKHPKLLQTLNIRTYEIGPDPDGFNVILNKYNAQYIRNLILERPYCVMNFDLQRFLQLLSSNNFKNLRVLEVSWHGDMILKKVATSEELNLLQSATIPIMPSLNSLKLNFGIFSESTRASLNKRAYNKSLNVLMIRLIAKHRKTLRSVNLKLPLVCFSKNEERFRFDQYVLQQKGLSTSDSGLYKNVDSLSKLEIRASVDQLFPTDFWTELVANQRKLVEVNVHLRELYVPLALCRQVVYNNMDTLVDVTFDRLYVVPNNANVEADESRPFDINLFHNCSSLRRLKLGKSGGSSNRLNVMVPEIINLSNVPKGLVEFEISDFLADTIELLTFCSSLSSSFKKLGLLCCGSFGSFGVNGSVMEAIVQNASLVEVSIEELTDCPLEQLKFESILNKIDTQLVIDPYSHIESVDLKRDSEEDSWKIKNLGFFSDDDSDEN